MVTSTDQVLPNEVLSIIVSFTLVPWPTHVGTQYDAAIASRFQNTFLHVNQFCRQTVLDDLAETLWLELEWHGRRGDPDLLECCLELNVPPTIQGILPANRPRVKLISSWPDNPDPDPELDLLVRSVIGPFVYQDFIQIVDFAISYTYTLDLSLHNLTPRTLRYADLVINPILPILTYCPEPGVYSFDVKIFGERILHSDIPPNWSQHLEHAKSIYYEYQRLRSSCLDDEAQIFALQAGGLLLHRWESRRDEPYGPETLPPSNSSDLQYVAKLRIQCKKIILEFNELATSVSTHHLLSDPRWVVQRFLHDYTTNFSGSTHVDMFFGFPDLDVARWYHTYGMKQYIYMIWQWEHGRTSIHLLVELGCLEIAARMFPENETWQRDLQKSVESFRQRHGKYWRSAWERRDLMCCLTYIDMNGVTREYLGIDPNKGDRDAVTPERLTWLPEIQRNHMSCIEELERDLGIQNGDWQMRV